jgi:hypothetical protein
MPRGAAGSSFEGSGELSRLARPKTARVKGARKKLKARPPARAAAASDPSRELAQHGYIGEGPIASGAFSMILRARVAASGTLVAVKSFDAAHCFKFKADADARDAELDVLARLRRAALAAEGDGEAGVGKPRSGGEGNSGVESSEAGTGEGVEASPVRGPVGHRHIANMVEVLSGPASTHLLLE